MLESVCRTKKEGRLGRALSSFLPFFLAPSLLPRLIWPKSPIWLFCRVPGEFSNDPATAPGSCSVPVMNQQKYLPTQIRQNPPTPLLQYKAWEKKTPLICPLYAWCHAFVFHKSYFRVMQHVSLFKVFVQHEARLGTHLLGAPSLIPRW